MNAITALLSVSDKSGIADFARALHARGVKLLSTGGTAQLLAREGLPVTEVSQVTGFPEMLDGRVKTLHPRIHAGLLARRDDPAHLAALREHGIGTIELLVINLYPFAQTVARPGCTLAEAIENIDIGGPAMLRAAAKNWSDVGVVVDPTDYDGVLAELAAGGLRRATKFRLAQKVFAHTAAYDGMIASWLTSLAPGAEERPDAEPAREPYPRVFNLQLTKKQDLRYGENPHQSAAFYADAAPAPGTLARAEQLQGKELSYNNIADADAAWECAKSFGAEPAAAGGAAGVACVIVKHANPCGVAVGATPLEAYRKALQTDPTSAFGGIVAFNFPVGVDVVEAINDAKQFIEVLIAPRFDAGARDLLAKKANLRLLQVPLAGADAAPGLQAAWPALDAKRIGGGVLLQGADRRDVTLAELKVVTRKEPTAAQLEDLLFAWKVAKFVKSNAIVFCGGGMTLGVGAGQMSRIDSARIAGIKAANAGLSLAGSVVASDAFFPFRDGLDAVVDAGASCIIQPGGSMRDAEVIAAADERGIAMVFTGVRHFRH